MSKLFSPIEFRGLTLPNRIGVAPMCQYAAVDGSAQDWHLMNLGQYAMGAAGLVFTEATHVSPEGRITPKCLGLWSDANEAALKRVVDFCRTYGVTALGIQIGHAGRKASVHPPLEGSHPLKPEEGAWTTLSASALPYAPDWHTPEALDAAGLARVKEQFVAATKRAARLGFDMLELHMAHGYLLSSFLSPLSNRRTDEYGGDLAGRMRYPLEVFAAVRKAWPAHKPISVRVSATDWMGPEGTTPEDTVVLARALSDAGCDLIDVSSGGNVADARPDYGRMYQVPFAEQIRHEVGIPVMAVGAILGSDHCNTILAAGRADLCCMARPHLGNPYLTLHAAAKYGFVDQPWPGQYLPGRALPDLR